MYRNLKGFSIWECRTRGCDNYLFGTLPKKLRMSKLVLRWLICVIISHICIVKLIHIPVHATHCPNFYNAVSSTYLWVGWAVQLTLRKSPLLLILLDHWSAVVELRWGPRGPGPRERPGGPREISVLRGFKGALKGPWNCKISSIYQSVIATCTSF